MSGPPVATTTTFVVVPTFPPRRDERPEPGRVGYAYPTLAEAEAAANEWRLRPYAHPGWPSAPDGVDPARDRPGSTVIGLRIERHDRTVHARDDAVHPNTLGEGPWPRLVISEGAGIHHAVHTSIDLGDMVIGEPVAASSALDAVQRFQRIVGAGELKGRTVLRARAETARIATIEEWQLRGARLEAVAPGTEVAL